MHGLTLVSMLIGISVCRAVTCTVDFEYLMAPKRAADRLHINTAKVSYSIFMPDSTCVEIEKLTQTKGEQVVPDGCLNGLGHVAIIQLGGRQGKKVQVNEVILGCDEFKAGTFILGNKWFEISFPKAIRDELLRMQLESDSFHKKTIDSVYF